jgi:hypothetical protein
VVVWVLALARILAVLGTTVLTNCQQWDRRGRGCWVLTRLAVAAAAVQGHLGVLLCCGAAGAQALELVRPVDLAAIDLPTSYLCFCWLGCQTGSTAVL